MCGDRTKELGKSGVTVPKAAVSPGEDYASSSHDAGNDTIDAPGSEGPRTRVQLPRRCPGCPACPRALVRGCAGLRNCRSQFLLTISAATHVLLPWKLPDTMTVPSRSSSRGRAGANWPVLSRRPSLAHSVLGEDTVAHRTCPFNTGTRLALDGLGRGTNKAQFSLRSFPANPEPLWTQGEVLTLL